MKSAIYTFVTTPLEIKFQSMLFLAVFLMLHMAFKILTQLYPITFSVKISPNKESTIKRLSYPNHFSNRIVSTIHAIAVFVTSVTILKKQGYCAGKPNSFAEQALMAFSFSYFSYDTIYEYFYGDFSSLLHHIISLVTILYSTIIDCSGLEICLAMAVTEVSTPFLNIRYYLSHFIKELENEIVKHKEDRTTHYEIESFEAIYKHISNIKLWIELLFFITFLLGRIVLGPWATFLTISSSSTPFAIKTGAFLVQLISFYWTFKIIKIAAIKIKRRNHKVD